MRVLAVVTDPATRQELEDFFRRRSHELTACRGIDAARTALTGDTHSFVLIDLETDLEGALELCQELRDHPLFVLTMAKGESETLRAAREAGASYEIFDQDMQRDAVERSRLESDLARAIERQEQILHYQPIVSLASGRAVAFEALIRWRHPERGLLGPGEIIPASEATGLILPLGRWILLQACRQAVAWRQRFPDREGLPVSVNLSDRQLLSTDFLEQLDGILAETGAWPAALAFEVKESLLVDSPESIAVLWRLRKRGFRLQIDNFGTGHTSLRELYRSPIETLKIDRSFIARMKPGGEDVEIVRATGALGSALGLSVVAEGVETAEQLDQVRELGLTHAQGYLFSRPLPVEQATEMLAEDPTW